MEKTVSDSLPARPLTTVEVEALDDQITAAAAYSGRPELDQVYAIAFITQKRGYALGFDEDTEQWVVIEEVDARGSESTELIDTGINEWIDEKYGDRYGNESIEV